jgi:hypothetical protein
VTGFIGKRLLPPAGGGTAIHVIVRDPSRLHMPRAPLRVFSGDIRDQA